MQDEIHAMKEATALEVETEEKVIRVSVRNLVEFIMRGGDIDNRTSGSMEKEAMLMGGRLHRKIQKSMDRTIMRKSL